MGQRYARRHAATGDADAVTNEEVPVAGGDVVEVDVALMYLGERAGVRTHGG